MVQAVKHPTRLIITVAILSGESIWSPPMHGCLVKPDSSASASEWRIVAILCESKYLVAANARMVSKYRLFGFGLRVAYCCHTERGEVSGRSTCTAVSQGQILRLMAVSSSVSSASYPPTAGTDRSHARRSTRKSPAPRPHLCSRTRPPPSPQSSQRAPLGTRKRPC